MKKVLLLLSVLAGPLAWADLFWAGKTAEAVFNDPANWASSSGGSGGAGVPDLTTGMTQFRNYQNGIITFDAAAQVAGRIKVDTKDDKAFVWKASDPSFGLSTSSTEGLRICDDAAKSPVTLQIDSGTYNVTFLRVGRADNSSAKLVMNGGLLTTTQNVQIGPAGGTGELVINGGELRVNADVLYVGEAGNGRLTMNGGRLAVNLSGNPLGVGFCHNAADSTAIVSLNGGELATSKFRTNYAKPGCRLVLNGTTVRALQNRSDFLDANVNLNCEIKEGGFVVDTDGHDITIAHPLAGVGGIVKKGEGTLRLTGANTFTGGIVVEGGKVIDAEGHEYLPGREPEDSVTVLDASAGGNLGTVQLHRAPLADYLANPDFTSYVEDYGAVGTETLETPRFIQVKVGSESKTYANLETGRTYTDALGGVDYSFTTESVAPRTLRVATPNGLVANVRDVGSWPTQGGRAMNQGRIFRGGNLDKFIGLSDDARAACYWAEIGLKSDIDLRLDDQHSALKNMTESPAAAGCAYYQCGLGWSGTQISDDSNGNFTNQIRRVFSILGTEGNLPAYFHCQIGTDRTGVTGLLLLGLMGVEEETLYRDYLMSNFANIGGSRDPGVPETFLRYLHRGNCNGGKYQYADNTYGLSVAARCRAYLEMCGVTTQEIANITEALSGETPDEVLARVDAYERANGFRTVSYIPYPGQDAIAIHRFAADGTRILPRTNPTRTGYTFLGWDVEHETDNGDGTASVYALWDAGDTPDRDPWKFRWDNAAGTARFCDGGNWYVSEPPSDNRTRGLPSIIDEAYFEDGDRHASMDEGDVFTAKKLQINAVWNSNSVDIRNGLVNIADHLVVGCSAASNELNIRGGDVTAGTLDIGFWVASGTSRVNVSGGTLTVKQGDWAGAVSIGKQNKESRGELNVSGGEVTVGAQVNVGFSEMATPSADAASVLAVSDGAMTVNGRLIVGSGTTGASGKVLVSGGELTVNNDLTLADQPESWAEAEVSGGKLVVTGTMRVNNHAEAKHAVFTVSGGEAAIETLRLGRQGDAELRLTGGLLKVGQLDHDQGVEAKADVFIDGGTVEFTKSSDNFFANMNSLVLGANGFTADSEDHSNVRFHSGSTFTGIGGLTKKGAGTIKLDSTYEAHGPIDVREGTLRLPANATIYCEGTNVAEGATLNLNGSTIVLVTKKVVSSEWTDASGDHDAANAYNWRSVVAYLDEEGHLLDDLTTTLEGVLPTGDTSVRIPTELALPEGFDAGSVKDVTYVAQSDISLIQTFGATYDAYAGGALRAEGDLTVRNGLSALLQAAVAWYDPSDVESLTVGEDGFISRIANKGYRGAAMDALPYQAGTGAVLASDELRENGLNVLVFTNNHGYVAASSLARIADGQSRALFAVSARQVMGDFVETETASAEVMAIEFAPKGASTENQTGRTTIDQVAWDDRMVVSAIKDGVLNNELVTGGLGANALGQMAVRTFDAKATVATAAARYRKPDDEMLTRKSKQITYENLIGGENLDVNYGRRAHWSAKSRGRLGEALAYDRDLSAAAMQAVEDYLAAKWLGDEVVPATSVTSLESLILAKATVDFEGAEVVIGRLAGSGAIANAKCVAIESLDFDLDDDGAAPGITLGVDLDLTGTAISVSDALCATIQRGMDIVLLETSGKIRLGGTRKFVSGRHNYAIRAERTETGSCLMLGFNKGLEIIIK